MQNGIWRALSAALLMAIGSGAHADEIKVFGLSEGKAVVALANGKLKVLRTGERLAEDITLQSATRDHAVFLIQGKARTLTIGQDIAMSKEESPIPRITITADASGHFFVQGKINGGPIRFLVDTGATNVFMSASDARRLGINYLTGRPGHSSTAGGTIRVYHVKLDSVQVGALAAANVDAVVSESDVTTFALLGMSFLNRMRMDRDGDQLTLTKRF